MFDWTGTKLHIHDSIIDAGQNCYLFVVTLPFSMYRHAETFLFTTEERDSPNKMGASRSFVSPVLKTGYNF